MQKLRFKSANQLLQFYKEHGYFAIYDCSTEYSDMEIDHYSLLAVGDPISLGCEANRIIPLEDESVLIILDRFLKTGTVKIHPNIFSVN
jgi:hypothetical protein